MALKAAIFSLLLLFFNAAVAQDKYLITGSVHDSSAPVHLKHAVVNVLNAQDSILLAFDRADDLGRFKIQVPITGTILMIISYPGYVSYTANFTLDTSKKTIDLGQIRLQLQSTLLKEIIIKGTAPAIKIKGDTVEFNAESYVIKPNSKVEDLIKQFPGLRVDQYGNITANGAAVKKVLLDGEEFFGDDPTLITKNIRGDMVDKVQLYEKKSEQATFTGIDDGKSEKTIDIKLKADKNSGHFGKVSLGGGNHDFYELQAMANFFKTNRKLAFYTLSGNNGKIGLGWKDNSRYSTPVVTAQGGVVLDDGVEEFDSTNGIYRGEGLPVAHAAGAHYNGKSQDGMESININYKGGIYKIDGEKERLTQNVLPNGSISSNSTQLFHTQTQKQKLDALYERKFNASVALKLSLTGSLKKSENENDYSTSSMMDDTILLNQGNRKLTGSNHETLFAGNAFISKKFKKDRRTVSLQLNFSSKKDREDQRLKSENNFYNTSGDIDSTQTIAQEKPGDINRSAWSSTLSYTEPLSKHLSLMFSTGFAVINSYADRKSFNASTEGNFDQLDTLFSNNFKLNQKSQDGGLIFSFNKKKTIFNTGITTLFSSYTQTNRMNLQYFKRSFINLNPQASYQYKFSQQNSLSVNYTGTTQQPTLLQLQPFRNNTDPLNEIIGSTNLKPSFRNRVEMRYLSYKLLNKSGVNIHGDYGLTANPIVNDVRTDASGKNTYQYINLTGYQHSNFSLSAGYNKQLLKPNVGLGLTLSGSGSTYYHSINQELNKAANCNYTATISISTFKDGKYEFFMVLIPGYNQATNSLKNSINNSGWLFDSETSFEVLFSKKLSLKAEGLFVHRQKTRSFDTGINRMIANLSLERVLLKDNSLKFSARVNDLFNQNNGFNRNSYNNTFVQERYTTIKRYFLFSLSWDFNKMGKGNLKTKP